MRKYIYTILLAIFLFGCEEVIEVEVPTEPARLSVDAVLRIDTSVDFTTAQIRLGLSSSFFDDLGTALVDQLQIQNPEYTGSDPTDGNVLLFTEIEPGVYEATKETDFFTSGSLLLTIAYNNEIYSAETSFVPTVPIDNLEQGDETLFSGEEIEIVIAFTDNGKREDFYLFDFDFNDFLVSEDEFYQGQTFEFSYFYDDGVEPGDMLNISILGVDETFYNYMNQLIVQSGGDQGPFQTPAATVRGNVVNTTNSDNFPLGYFAVVQEFSERIIIE